MAEGSGNSGMPFIVGGLVVAVGVLAYVVSGGTFWVMQPTSSTTNVTVETSGGESGGNAGGGGDASGSGGDSSSGGSQ